ncbi:S-adenosylmethionine carrier 1, chloroplastic/mitochondrial [Linum perenne]
MVSRNDPMEPFFNSIQSVKGALSPLEQGIRKAAKDFEACWGSGGWNNDKGFVNELKCGEAGNRVHSKFQIRSVDKKNVCNGCFAGKVEERKRGLSIRVPVRAFLGLFASNLEHQRKGNGGADVSKKRSKVKEMGNGDGSCTNCMKFAVTWSVLVNGFVEAFPNPLKNNKNRVAKMEVDDGKCSNMHLCNGGSKQNDDKQGEVKGQYVKVFQKEKWSGKEKVENHVSLECLIGFLFDHLAHNLQKLDLSLQKKESKSCNSEIPNQSQVNSHFDHFKTVMSIWEARRIDVDGFLGNLSFARVGSVPSTIVGVPSSVDEEGDDGNIGSSEEAGGGSPQKLASGLLNIPLSNVERLRSSLSSISLAELIELVPQLGKAANDYPDKKKLFSVQDFFRYTESEGKRFFEELDRDGDGQVTLEDLEIAVRRRKLPKNYARDFMRRARSHLFSKSFGWKQFLSVMEQREPTILRAYTSLSLSKSGTLKKSEILASLKKAGLPANEENAMAMMRFLKADAEESISYGHFRNFMLLLPSDRLQDDPRNIWFEAATVVAVAPPVELPAGNVLRSAFAGGLSCALSTSLMHPVDTVKTRLQASTLTFPEIISKLPEIGVQGLYRGSIPAILGQFSSHGLRTGIFEASKLLLINVAPTLPDFQVQSIASLCSTVLGTAVRIPCEVLKQRLQAGIFDNVGEAIVGTWQQDGMRGFFRGTAATLCREVPFYVVGMGLYGESKKAAQQFLRRELEPWETICVGAVSGGLTAVLTTPFDVMKTRMMTAPQGRHIPMMMIAYSILRREGPLGLFKGALPRFFWIAPLGAMNFAGYELARKAMAKREEEEREAAASEVVD